MFENSNFKSCFLGWRSSQTVCVFLHVLAEAEQEEGEPFWVFDCLILLSMCARTHACAHMYGGQRTTFRSVLSLCHGFQRLSSLPG